MWKHVGQAQGILHLPDNVCWTFKGLNGFVCRQALITSIASSLTDSASLHAEAALELLRVFCLARPGRKDLSEKVTTT